MKFSQKFVTYHGCGNCYVDGTNQLEEPSNKCFSPTNNPFLKRPEDSNNKIVKLTRNQLRWKAHASRSYCRKYFNYLNLCNQKNYKFNFPWKPEFSDYSTDDESNSYSSDDDANSDSDNDAFQIVNSLQPVIFKQMFNNSITDYTEQNSPNNKLTGEYLVIIEDNDQKSVTSNEKETPNNKQQTPDNK